MLAVGPLQFVRSPARTSEHPEQSSPLALPKELALLGLGPPQQRALLEHHWTSLFLGLASEALLTVMEPL